MSDLEEKKANYKRRLSLKRKWYDKNKEDISSYNKQYYKKNIKLPSSVRKSLNKKSRRGSRLKRHSRRGSRRHSSKSRRRMLKRKEAEVDEMIQRLVNLKAQYRRELHNK